jgi:hypothetical protein
VEKGLGLADIDPVPDPVAKGLVVPDRDPDREGVRDGVAPGVAEAVGDRVTVPDPDPDPVRVLEGVTRGEGVPVWLVVCVKEGVKVLLLL